MPNIYLRPAAIFNNRVMLDALLVTTSFSTVSQHAAALGLHMI